MDNSDLLFFAAMAGFYLLRKVLANQAKSKSGPPPSRVDITPPAVTGRDYVQASTALGAPTAMDASTALDAPTAMDASTALDAPTAMDAPTPMDALNEIRSALGMSAYARKRPEYVPEPFPDQEDSFERRRSAGIIEMERADNHTVFDKPFEKHVVPTNSDFHQHWDDHRTSFGYHSPLDSTITEGADPRRESLPPRDARLVPETVESDGSSRTIGFGIRNIRSGLDNAGHLREAIILSEILAPPLSRRTRSPRRHPS